MLKTFFRTNMPYGIYKTSEGKLICFNREYKPIGFSGNVSIDYEDYPTGEIYPGISDKRIVAILGHSMVEINDGVVKRAWFYDDKSFPFSSNESWSLYMSKLKSICLYGEQVS